MASTQTGTRWALAIGALGIIAAIVGLQRVARDSPVAAPAAPEIVAALPVAAPIADAIAQVAPQPEQVRADAAARIAAAAAAAGTGAAGTSGGLDRRDVEVARAVAREMKGIDAHPLRSQLKAQLLDDFIDKHGGLGVAVDVVTHPQDTLAAFGEDQALVRHLSLEAIEARAQDNPELVTGALQTMSRYLSDHEKWEKGVEFDYRDLLYAYFKTTSFDVIEKDVDSFLADVGHNPKLARLIRSFVLQRYDASVDEARLYPVLRKIGGVS